MKRFILFFAILLMGANAFAQHKIQSPSRDLAVSIKGCHEYNGTVEVDLLLTCANKDHRLFFEPIYSSAFDDEGNQYNSSQITFNSPGGNSGSGYYDFPADIPVKFKVIITGVDKNATIMKLIKIGLMSGTYGTMEPTPIVIKELSINRE